jgi:peptidoglycan/LPS O-acetylase OafA/YrhL
MGLPAPTVRTQGRANNFTFARLALALLVLVAHSPEIVDGDRHREILTRWFHGPTFGEVAVAGFFLISGFLILQSWDRSRNVRSYLSKRVRRIFPGFLVAAVLSAIVAGFLGAEFRTFFGDFQVLPFFREILLLRPPSSVPPVFAGQPHPLINGSLWTIEYEFRCYLLVVLLGLCGIASRKWLWAVLTLVTLGFAAYEPLSAAIDFPGRHRLIVDSVFFLRFVSWFCVGGAFYLFRGALRFTWPAIVCAALCVVAGVSFPVIARPVLTLAGGYLLFAFIFTPIPQLVRFGEGADISYGVYLYGWPIQKLIHWYAPGMSPWALLALTLPLCCACGWLSWTLVEKWFVQTAKAPVPVVVPATQQPAWVSV